MALFAPFPLGDQVGLVCKRCFHEFVGILEDTYQRQVRLGTEDSESAPPADDTTSVRAQFREDIRLLFGEAMAALQDHQKT